MPLIYCHYHVTHIMAAYHDSMVVNCHGISALERDTILWHLTVVNY